MNTVRSIRGSIIIAVTASLVAGVGLAPFVVLHEHTAHGEAAHQPHPVPAETGVAGPSHHHHGSHVHVLPSLADARLQPRSAADAAVAPAPVLADAFPRVAAVVRVFARTTRPTRSIHPLALTGILRV